MGENANGNGAPRYLDHCGAQHSARYSAVTVLGLASTSAKHYDWPSLKATQSGSSNDDPTEQGCRRLLSPFVPIFPHSDQLRWQVAGIISQPAVRHGLRMPLGHNRSNPKRAPCTVLSQCCHSAITALLQPITTLLQQYLQHCTAQSGHSHHHRQKPQHTTLFAECRSTKTTTATKLQ
jgi:hypothetical protein